MKAKINKDGSDLQSVPDKRSIEDNLEPKPGERVLLHTWDGRVVDITENLEKMIEKDKKEIENRGLRGLFKKIRNKVSKMANDTQKKRKPEKRIMLQTWDGDEVDITNTLKKMIEEKRDNYRKGH